MPREGRGYCRSLGMTKGTSDKGETIDRGRAVTLGLREGDGRTTGPSASLGMTTRREWFVVGVGARHAGIGCKDQLEASPV